MALKKISFGIGAGILSLAADGISGLLILRLLLHYLEPATAGFWVLVTSAGSLLLLLQCGMGPTIARAVAHSRVTGDISAVKRTLGAIKVVFRYIAIAVTVAAVILFLIYLWPAAKRGNIRLGTALSWFPYALGMLANLQGQSSLFVLDGYGEVGWDRMFRTIYSTLGIMSAWVALYFGSGLPSLGIIYLFLNLLFWLGARKKLRFFLGDSFQARSPQKGQVAGLFLDGSKLLLLNLLTYLITQFTIFIVEKQFGIKEVTPYVAMLKVGMLISSLGGLVPQMLYPYVAATWAAHNYRKSRLYYLFGLASAVTLSLALSVVVFLSAHWMFRLWLGPGLYLGDEVFGAVLLFYLLFVHHGAHATPALAVVGQAFAIPATINAILVLLFAFYLPKQLGLVGIPLAMLLGSVMPSAYVVWRSWAILMRNPEAGSVKAPGPILVSSEG